MFDPGARRRKKQGFSLIELLIVVAILITLAALAIPNFMRARIQANESAVAAAMRSITTAIVSYELAYQAGYPNNLIDLGPPPVGTPASAAAADLIDRALAMGTRSGYNFTYAAIDANGDGRNDSYTVHADPSSPGVTGVKHFFVNQTNVIRYNASAVAGPADRPIPQ